MTTRVNYEERVTGEAAPATIGCSIEQGRAQELLLIENVVNVSTLYDAISELLGGVYTNNGNVDPTDDTRWLGGSPGLTRYLPAQHAIMPWYIASIAGLRGVGGTFQQITNPFVPFQPEIQQYCLYNKYEVTADFGPRPYPVYPDEALTKKTDYAYYADDGSGPTFYTGINEWERFCDIDIKPTNDTISMQVGAMCFNAVGIPVDSRQFPAQPKLYLNNEALTITWYMVPQSYYTSPYSYLRKWRGRVNQDDWETSTFGTYLAGELLYLGCTMKRYTPPFATVTPQYVYEEHANGDVTRTSILPDYNKYCNIEMQFLYTKRKPKSVEVVAPTRNFSYVWQQGHNLMPYFGSVNDPDTSFQRTFVYCSTSPTAAANSCPLWLSFPIEQLFQNPDWNPNGLDTD